MVYQITFKDGTVDVVDRCWLVESQPRSSKHTAPAPRWAVQRRAGAKLRWYKEEDITDAKFATTDMRAAFDPPRKAG